MLQKTPLNFPFYEKIKIFKKGTFVVELFVIDGSFDYDWTLSLVMDGKILFENFSRQNIQCQLKYEIY
jgi:hypothetical protein